MRPTTRRTSHERKTPDERKLRELVLYLAKMSSDDEDFGATKLQKLAFYCEFEAYAKLGKPLSGARFVKEEHGPYSQHLREAEKKLVGSGLAANQEVERGGHTQRRLIPLKPDEVSMEGFTPKEIEVVHTVLKTLRRHNASSIRALSHRYMGWRLARAGEEIPYETVFLSSRELSDGETEYGRTLAKALEGKGGETNP